MTVETTSDQARKIVAQVNSVLLTPAEVGKAFVKGTYTPADPKDTSARLPCGQRSAAVLFPNALRTGTEIVQGNSAQLDEAVSVYPDATSAAAAYAASVAGFNCTHGTAGTTAVSILENQDVTAQVGGDRARAWKLTIGKDSAVLIAVHTGLIFVGFTFVVAAGADSSALPNPLDLAKLATARLTNLQK